MTAIWFIGDLHFNHEKVSAIRGFDTVTQHDNHLILAWDAFVKPNDLVYVMGDISSGTPRDESVALEIIDHLPGRKRLISGNHDSVAGIHRKPSRFKVLHDSVFERVNDYGAIRVEGQRVALSHFPYASQGDGPGRGEGRYLQNRLPDIGGLLIHAHTHHIHPTNGSVTGRELCVSWDAWDRMVGYSDIANWLKKIGKTNG